MGGPDEPAERSGPAEQVEAFFGRPALLVAPDLLGSRLSTADVTVELTEVEAYEGERDPASHAFRGVTARNAVMFGPPGRLYVYFSYGMHHCLNLVCGASGTAAAVLLRAGRVVRGAEAARSRRGAVAAAALARGPGNLARALGVTVACTGTTVWDGPVRWQAADAGPRPAPRCGPRVGVRSGADQPWRLWLPEEPSVSAYRRHPHALPTGRGATGTETGFPPGTRVRQAEDSTGQHRRRGRTS